MSKIRYYAAMLAAKTAWLGLRILGRNASFLPGKIAVTICKDFLGHLQLPEHVICVTGTNGKTTISNLLTNVLRQSGYTVTNNSLGSNVQAGVATALLENATFGGRVKTDMAVLEVDERSSLLIYPYIKPSLLVCSNIMRDSIKRNAHTDFISFVLNKAIPAGTRIVLNADDIINCHLGLDNPDRTYFGITAEAPQDSTMPMLRDIVYCPECGSLLEAEYIRYNHIGRIYCPNCSYATPQPDFAVTAIDRENGTFTVSHDGVDEQYKLVNDNITNLYNFCAAIAALTRFGLPYEKIKAAFDSVEIVKSRHNELSVGGRNLKIILAKGQNPVACSGVYRYTAGCAGENKTVLITVDDVGDNINNSENVSWIYDADYSVLGDPSIAKVIFVGPRCTDHQLRAQIAGIPAGKVAALPTWQEGVKLVDMENTGDIYLLYDPYKGAEMEAIKAALLTRMEGGNNE